MFHVDDYELAVLQEGHCPFCRGKNEEILRGHLTDEELDI